MHWEMVGLNKPDMLLPTCTIRLKVLLKIQNFYSSTWVRVGKERGILEGGRDLDCCGRSFFADSLSAGNEILVNNSPGSFLLYDCSALTCVFCFITVNLEIFGVKIFSEVHPATKIKNTKIN